MDKILIVEDDRDIQELLKNYFEKALRQVDFAVVMCKKKGAFPMKKIITTPLLSVLVLTVLCLCACGRLDSNTCSADAEEISASTPSGYTQEEFNTVMSLKPDGYEEMTVSAFNSYIDKALFMSENSEYIFEYYEKLVPLLSESSPENEFILTTMNLSLTELSASINNEKENFVYDTFENEVINTADPYDLDGNINYLSYLLIPCHIYYSIDNADTLTVDMRDKAFIEYRNLLQQEIDSVPIANYASENLQNQLNNAFDKITQGINSKYAGIKFSFEIIDVVYNS